MTPVTRRVLSFLLILGTFVVAYAASAMVWFPRSLVATAAGARLLLPPSLAHKSDPTALPPGTELALPDMIPVNGGAAFTPPQVPIGLTVFDVSCQFSGKSVPYWRRADRAFAKAKIPSVFAACAPTLEAARSFAKDYEMEIPFYYTGDCARVAPQLKMESKIVQYVVDGHRRVVSAWVGMPVFRSAENDKIAQMVNAATTAPR